ncbi:nuclear transport factor 2 family protein [Candidatus Bathyarchaeota archaeon]|nr:nuclear transport factor 2 family protein [Candidatus Bathyarchaeota archaeon]
MSVKEMMAAIFGVHENIAKKDVEKMLPFFAEDATLIFPGVKLDGHEGVRRWVKWLDAQFPKVAFRGVTLTIEGRRAVHEFVLDGTTPEGLTASFDCVAVYEFRNGKITQFRCYFDVLTIAKQIAKGFFAKRAVKSMIDQYEKGLREIK